MCFSSQTTRVTPASAYASNALLGVLEEPVDVVGCGAGAIVGGR